MTPSPRSPSPATASGAAHCQVTELFALLGQPHVLEILAVLHGTGGRTLRFSDLQSQLRISPKTLADRLRVLVAAGLLDRRSFRERPPRVEYRTTAKTADLDELFALLHQWADRHSLTAAPVGSSRAT